MGSKQTAEKKEGWFSSSSFKAVGGIIGKGIAVVGAGMAAVGTAVAAMAGGITKAGFTSSGIAAGSKAVAIQSSIGSVTAGSTFAKLQSIAALGIVKMVGVGGVIVGVVGGLAYGGYKLCQSASRKEAKSKL